MRGVGAQVPIRRNSGTPDAPHLHFHLIDSDSVFGGEGIPFVFERFELMGAFEKINDNLDQSWVPKKRRLHESWGNPLGRCGDKVSRP